MSYAVQSYLEANAGEARALLERLCRQPSVAAQGLGMAEMADLTEGLLRDAGFATRRLHAEGAPPAIYGERRGRGGGDSPSRPYTLWKVAIF